jgi:hypothetical protein
MPHGLLENLHRIKLLVTIEIIRHPPRQPGLRPQQCRLFRKFFADAVAENDPPRECCDERRWLCV